MNLEYNFQTYETNKIIDKTSLLTLKEKIVKKTPSTTTNTLSITKYLTGINPILYTLSNNRIKTISKTILSTLSIYLNTLI